MANELVWPIEEIPDTDSVFMRAHREHFSDGELHHGVFRKHDGGMSVNWARYASAEETKQQAKEHPNHYGVGSMPVSGIRQIDDLSVEHTPELTNRAHSDVYGLPGNREQRTKVRFLLLRIANIVIPLTIK